MEQLIPGGGSPERMTWDAEIDRLGQALNSGDYAYGGYQGAYDDLYNRLGIPAGVSSQEAQSTIGNLYDYFYAPGGVKGATAPVTPTYDAEAAALATQKAGEQANYDDQIDTFRGLLGTVGSQRDSGLASLRDQKDSVMRGYDEQGVQNTQARQSGTEQVDRYAGNNMTQLQRLLQGSNAGNSSVGRDLIPYLISKSAGQRRQSVFNTAGENERNITQARNEADNEFAVKENSFLSNLLSKQNEIEGQIGSLQGQKAAASGAGYEASRAASAATRANMATRNAEIQALFSKYTPVTRTPELAKYQVDPAQLATQNQGMPSESSYYLKQLLSKKRNEGLV